MILYSVNHDALYHWLLSNAAGEQQKNRTFPQNALALDSSPGEPQRFPSKKSNKNTNIIRFFFFIHFIYLLNKEKKP